VRGPSPGDRAFSTSENPAEPGEATEDGLQPRATNGDTATEARRGPERTRLTASAAPSELQLLDVLGWPGGELNARQAEVSMPRAEGDFQREAAFGSSRVGSALAPAAAPDVSLILRSPNRGPGLAK
jgi:hypothetical protein